MNTHSSRLLPIVLTVTRAATVQLSVPILMAIAGILWLQEPLSMRLVIASALILGGLVSPYGTAVNCRAIAF